MKNVIEYKLFGFRLNPNDEKPIVVASSSLPEALEVFSIMHNDEPVTIHLLDTVYLMDTDYE